ncbi:SNARE protein syntaxin 18/UFE1 [Rhodotorula toruloides]|uniref:SNARE protein syntaxin 18/UFE1 n=1 Tax=Rhodotorula toruloides TaxID=5286 RepID=A0A511K7Q0_RHOTO|nr:SNARE protein syntaxin 18/UFE1 [Rhodotorula toruloides]
MLATDRTAEFKEAVRAKEHSQTPSKRQRIKFGRTRLGPDGQEDAWTRQAEQVATNLRSFSNFLASIRRAYLDLGSSSHPSSRNPPQRNLDPSKGLAAWEGVRWLTDRERDEIDFAVKVALRKSVDRVRELEALEKARVDAEKRENPNAGLSRFLGLNVAPSVSPTSEALASHRSLVTFYLNTMLASVSQRQRDQQEARVKRQLEKTQSLGGTGGGGALGMDELGRQMAEKAKTDRAAHKGKGKADGAEAIGGVGQVPSLYRPAPLSSEAGWGFDEDEDDPLGSTLTADQIQQFEAEESALLKATQSDLESLKTAESSLLEIASLQSQLAIHLTQQAELTDNLWEEAITVSGEVDRGNKQLKKAKERGRESRMWLLIFLFMSSFTLLFLDYYA